MKRNLAAAALFALVLSGCDFSFVGQSAALSGESLHCVVSDLPDGAGKRYDWYDSKERLVYSEDHYIQGGNTVQIQHFSSGGSLLWYQALAWTAEGNLDTQREYDAGSALQWARRYSYLAAVPDGQILIGARFGPGAALESATVNDWDGSRIRRENFYGEGMESYGQKSLGSSSVPGGNLRAAASRAVRAYIAPPAAPALAMPADEASISLPPSGRRYWFYDGSADTPASSLTFDSQWYPVAFSRSDPGRHEDIGVAIGYDSQRRIVKKTTQYGSAAALDLSIQYEGSSLFPVKISTTGASLLLPLDYGIEYDANHRPTRLSVSNKGNVLHYFSYAYDGPGVPLSLDAAKSVDPFRFMDQLMAAGLVISHYDGDGALIETFSALAVANGLRVEVRKPNGELNGYYELLRDGNGNPASLSSYGPGGARAWSYSYDYSTAVTAAIAEFPGAAGRLLEYLPDGSVALAQAFLYDLLM